MKVIKDISYGVVPVFYKNGEVLVLLIHQISYRGDSFWIFPKGHLEKTEIGVQAALRELKEETGLRGVTLKDDFSFSVGYSFIHENSRVEKTVIYYLGICSDDNTQISQPNEVKELRWCTVSEAETLLTHQNSKEVLKAVANKLVLGGA